MARELVFRLRIDWADLKDQKRVLLQLLEEACRLRDTETVNGLEGILGLVDELQDLAVDKHDLPYEAVFDTTPEPERPVKEPTLRRIRLDITGDT